MSEFTTHQKKRVEQLEVLFNGIMKGDKAGELVAKNQVLIDSCVPADIILVVDRLVQNKIPMEQLKKGINKLLNLLYKTLNGFPYNPPSPQGYLACFVENNRICDQKLQHIKPLIRSFNKEPQNSSLRLELKVCLEELEKYDRFYTIKENVLFPVIEKYLPEFRCLQVMWSFHDDIRQNLKTAIHELKKEVDLDMKVFNRAIGDLFFTVYAIKFREERILFPMVQDIVPEKELNSLLPQSIEIGFPFYNPEPMIDFEEKKKMAGENDIDLETGHLNVEQIKLLFNHLPVDITYVDEHNKVKYFSTPKKRIFPRTKAIIGRDVHNCHPPESVHVVEKIVEAFRAGEKDVASFWINMKEERLLIQYFAIRDEMGNYKGVVEVSQEISDIQNLEGEKRLLDWGD